MFIRKFIFIFMKFIIKLILKWFKIVIIKNVNSESAQTWKKYFIELSVQNKIK